MKIISADFNAGTESGSICLDMRGPQEDLRAQGVQVGDWMWLSDGELIVGAQLAVDDRYGTVGVPRWETLVHLDDEETQDASAVWDQFLHLPRRVGPDPATEARIFQLLTIFEAIAPPSMTASLPPGYLALRRATALHSMGEPALALVELGEALRAEAEAADRDAPALQPARVAS